MSWYFIDAAGTTQGPVEKKVLENKWQKQELNSESYVWNGTTVNQWSLIKNTILYDQLNKPKPAAPSSGSRPTGGAPKRPKPAGGGMANLLDAIRSGKKLKKSAPKPAESSGSSGGSAKPKGKGKMSLQEQLAARLKKSTSTSNSRGGSKPAVKKQAPKPKPVAKNTSMAQKKSFGSKKTTSSNNGPTPNKSKLKRMIDDCKEDWVLKAVEKLLQ